MKKVMVAEDEAAIREFIVINLKRSGFEVVEAENGEEALRQYQNYGGNFDIALLDIMMPVIDGLEVCKQLRKKSSTLGILMLTAKTQEMDKVTGLMLGADCTIPADIDYDHIRWVIEATEEYGGE